MFNNHQLFICVNLNYNHANGDLEKGRSCLPTMGYILYWLPLVLYTLSEFSLTYYSCYGYEYFILNDKLMANCHVCLRSLVVFCDLLCSINAHRPTRILFLVLWFYTTFLIIYGCRLYAGIYLGGSLIVIGSHLFVYI